MVEEPARIRTLRAHPLFLVLERRVRPVHKVSRNAIERFSVAWLVDGKTQQAETIAFLGACGQHVLPSIVVDRARRQHVDFESCA